MIIRDNGIRRRKAAELNSKRCFRSITSCPNLGDVLRKLDVNVVNARLGTNLSFFV